MNTDKRRFARVHAPLRCRVLDTTGSATYLRVGNISMGGLLAHSHERPDLGGIVWLELSQRDALHSVEIAARAVWVQKLPAGSAMAYAVGLEFVGVSALIEDELGALLTPPAYAPQDFSDETVIVRVNRATL